MSSADDRNKSADYVPEEDSTEMEVGRCAQDWIRFFWSDGEHTFTTQVVNATADVDDEDDDVPAESFDTEDEDVRL